MVLLYYGIVVISRELGPKLPWSKVEGQRHIVNNGEARDARFIQTR